MYYAFFNKYVKINETHDAVGHEVMPLQFAAAVLHAVEFLHLGDVVLKLHG